MFKIVGTLSLATTALFASQATAFTVVPPSTVSQRPLALTRSRVPLMMASKNNEDFGKNVMTSAVAAAFALSSLLTPELAMGLEPDFGSDTIVAARSGGRTGGRAARAPPAPARTYDQPPPSANYGAAAPAAVAPASPVIMAAPPMMVAPPPPTPFGGMGGIGLGLGISAIQGVGREIRESGQERELARNKAELEVAKQRENELDQRLRSLEQSKNQPQQLAPATQ